MSNLKPKCFGRMEAAVNAQGFLLPCCWCDQPPTLEDKNFKKLIKDKFHLDNVEKISDVIYSDEWQEFKKDLKESNYEKLPPICKIKCEGDKINVIKKYPEGTLKQ